MNRLVVASGPAGAWARLERGELELADFYPVFDSECRAAGGALSAQVLLARVGEAALPRPAMLAAIGRLRERGLRTAALTNNWLAEDGSRTMGTLREHFDVFVESAVEGLRKPAARIYTIVCERLGVAPAEAVFLDDIGTNLKPARALGMATIKVAEPAAALRELGDLLGFPLDGRPRLPPGKRPGRQRS